MRIELKAHDQIMGRFGHQLEALGEGKAERALYRAGKHTLGKARTRVVRALTKQTGLPRKTIDRAVKDISPKWGTLNFTLQTRGGNVSLKYFRARETRAGVSAAPWGKRQVWAGSFMRAGWWPKRVDKPNWNGQVFLRTGSTTGTGMDRFEKQRSGLFIPEELLKDETAAAWETVIKTDLFPRVQHEISRLLPR
ncbi:hypothetical protein GGR34_003712 [Microvirga flocculans]|uniref:Phage tail protein n=1 Tax=Microvirga flocculans TaxID=217168 RepID=A0A7W6IIE0_9HYPH|nr:hypothetical protein [Microvirga flocculans]MBB4042027.1 hypothetical protein [Microvirga flocculans]